MRCRVLIVEDSPIFRTVIRRAVVNAGIPDDDIREAGNGKEALALLETSEADLILLDLNMPVMDGAEFIKETQERPEIGTAKVVAVTTEGNSKKLGKLKELGVDDFLRKPFSPDDLKAIVEEMLGDD
jgi:two-component system chemotaxis response regulator CheY